MQQHRRGLGIPVLCGVATAALVVTAASSLASAAQLDQQTCNQLKADVALLEGMGVRANMAKGAAWGKANLRAADLEKIKKLIEIDEFIAFRCPRAKPVEPPGAAAAAKPKVKVPTKAAKAQGDPPAPAVAAAKPKPRPKPATADAAPVGPATPAPQTAAAQPKPKPKPPAPKPQDAYAPPPKAPAPQ